MLTDELLTVRQQDLPVKLIPFKNDSPAFVELEIKTVHLARSFLPRNDATCIYN